MPRESLCIKVPKRDGEKAILTAKRVKLSDNNLDIHSDEKFVYVPIVRKPSKKEQMVFNKEIIGFQLEVHNFQERPRSEKTLVDVLENKLPPHLLARLPKALDIIGDIAIIEIPKELEIYRKTLADAVLQIHRNVRTVLAKAGAVGGTYRLREFELIGGEARTTAIHKELGCTYYVDLAKVYFSPRLSHEHERVASLVQRSETVVDLFAGVGPFAVLIAKKTENVKVYALDINPDAIEYLKKNIRFNRVQNRVFPIFGDARKIVEEKLWGIADRVIMNLPESALEYVDVACKAIKHDGGVVHLYHFTHFPDSVEELKNRFSQTVERTGRKVEQILSLRNVRETAPYEYQVVLDARIV